MPLESLSLKVTYFCGIDNGCMRAATVSPPNNVILYRIPFDYAQVLDSKRKAAEQGYTDSQFKNYQKELTMAGIYVLIDTEIHSVYIGQAYYRVIGKGLIHRMLEDHKRRRDPIRWDVGFALTSKTEDLLSKNELSYLEWLFYSKAVEAGRYALMNNQCPSAPSSESARADAEEKLGNFTKDAFNMLARQAGCDVFVARRRNNQRTSIPASGHPGNASRRTATGTAAGLMDSRRGGVRGTRTDLHQIRLLHMSSRGADAFGYLDPDDPQGKRFIVKAGSKLAPGMNESLKTKPGYYARRQELERNGTDEALVLLADEVFNSISAAASVIGGTSLNGSVWK